MGPSILHLLNILAEKNDGVWKTEIMYFGWSRFFGEMARYLLLSHTLLWYVEAELATAAVTTEPVVLEQLEMVETMPEPTVIDAAEVVVVTNELLTSDEAFES